MVKEYIKKIVKEKQIGVIFSDHNLDEVRSLCERVIAIKDGKKIYDKGLEEDGQYEIGVESINQGLIIQNIFRMLFTTMIGIIRKSELYKIYWTRSF